MVILVVFAALFLNNAVNLGISEILLHMQHAVVPAGSHTA